MLTKRRRVRGLYPSVCGPHHFPQHAWMRSGIAAASASHVASTIAAPATTVQAVVGARARARTSARRGGIGGVDERAFGCENIDRFVRAVVHANVFAERAEQHLPRRRNRI